MAEHLGGSSGEEIILDVHVRFNQQVERAVVGYLVRSQLWLDVLGTNTYAERTPITGLAAGERIVLRSRMRMPLQPGPYTVAPAVVDERNVERADYFDWVDAALAFEVTRPLDRIFHAMFYVPQRLRVERGETTP